MTRKHGDSLHRPVALGGCLLSSRDLPDSHWVLAGLITALRGARSVCSCCRDETVDAIFRVDGFYTYSFSRGRSNGVWLA